MPWLYLAIGVISEVVATSALHMCNGFTKIFPSIIVIAGYALAFYFFSLTLRFIPLGIAYAIWAGMGIALVAIVGYLFFHQPLDLPAIIGISLIICGAVVLNVFSKTFGVM